MKLTARVQRLADAASVEKPSNDVGIVWSTQETVIAREELEPGQRIAVDMFIDEPAGPEPEAMPAIVRTVERISSHSRDRGFVYDAAGTRIGRMVETRHRLLRWELSEAGSAGR